MLWVKEGASLVDTSGNIVVKYRYDAYGNRISITDTSGCNLGNINPFRYKGYYYDNDIEMYYCKSRFYVPLWHRWLNSDSISCLEPENITSLNLFTYCNNNPVMYVDRSGHFPILATILCVTALIGMGLTIGGVASDNNTLTAVGLGMVAVPALISGGIALGGAIVTGATLTGIIGGGTILAGIGTGAFMSAEIQEATGNENWIMDTTGMSDGLYNTLMISTAAIATLGTAASSIAHSFDIASIDKIGKLTPSNHANQGYFGIRYKTGRGSLHSLEIHNHAPHGFHFQRNVWNPATLKISSKKAVHWTWYLMKF